MQATGNVLGRRSKQAVILLLVAGFALSALAPTGMLTPQTASASGSGTIRQEINLLDATYSKTDSIITSDEFSQLDASKYSGTVSYYFEVVGSASSGSSGNIHLRRHGTTTDDATIAISNLGTSSTRYRSAAFTAPGSPTEYSVHADAAGSGKTLTLKAARIIIIQTSSPMTSTETQLEIGSYAIAQTNTDERALPSPKYWTYKAGAWDNNPTFYAEVSYKTLNSTAAVWLQEDDGAYGAWNDKIVIAQDDTSPVRTRTAFTPVDGKHYRLSSVISPVAGTYNYDIYSAKIVVDQTGTSMDPISKLQPQYLLGNSPDDGSTGMQGYQTLYDPSEWSGTEYYKFAIDSDNPFNAVRLADASNSGSAIAKSAVAGSYQPISPQPQYVQGNYGFDGGSVGPTLDTTLASDVTAGNMIIVVTGSTNPTYTPAVSDNQGNTYSTAAVTTNPYIPYKIGVYYTIASSSGPLTVTHTAPSNTQYKRVAALEYSDIDSFDTAAGKYENPPYFDSGPFTTSHNDELIFGWGISDNGITTAGWGFTQRLIVGSETVEDKFVGSAGSYSATFPSDPSQWAAIGAGFYNSNGLTLSFTNNHEIDTDITNSQAGSVSASRIIVDVNLPTSVVSVSVSDGNVSYGTLATGSSQDTTSGGLDDTQTASNDGTTAEDFNIKGQDSANWTLAGSPGADQYQQQFCTAGSGSPDPCDATPAWTTLSTSYQSLGSNIAANSDKRFDLKLLMPTSSASKAQQSVDVTIQAVEH